MRNAESKHHKKAYADLMGLNLADLGYDSLAVIELNIMVEAEAEDIGVTTDLDDDTWSLASPVMTVVTEIERLLDGKDIR